MGTYNVSHIYAVHETCEYECTYICKSISKLINGPDILQFDPSYAFLTEIYRLD